MDALCRLETEHSCVVALVVSEKSLAGNFRFGVESQILQCCQYLHGFYFFFSLIFSYPKTKIQFQSNCYFREFLSSLITLNTIMNRLLR